VLGKFIITEKFNKQILYDYAKTVFSITNDIQQLESLNTLLDLPENILTLVSFASIILFNTASILTAWWEISEEKNNINALIIAETIFKYIIYFTRLFNINDINTDSFNSSSLADIILLSLPFTESENLDNRKKEIEALLIWLRDNAKGTWKIKYESLKKRYESLK